MSEEKDFDLRDFREEVKAEIERLQAENERLKAENAKLKSENIRLETRVQNAENDLHNIKLMLQTALAEIDDVTDAAAVPPHSGP